MRRGERRGEVGVRWGCGEGAGEVKILLVTTAAHGHVEPGPGLADAVVEEPLLVPARLLAHELAQGERRPPVV